MNEKDYRTLLSWGYKVDGECITDSNGNYVPSVTKNGITINSAVDKKLWESAKASIAKREMEETPDPIKRLSKFEKSPSKTPLKNDLKESYPYYRQVQGKVGKACYLNAGDSKKLKEKKTIKQRQEQEVKTVIQIDANSIDINNSKMNEFIILPSVLVASLLIYFLIKKLN